jgi:hypothetical protein
MNLSETTKFLRIGNEAVVERLIAEKLIRVSPNGDIRREDMEVLVRSNATLARIATIRRELATEDVAKKERADKYSARREFLLTQIEEARADGNHAEALRLFDRLDEVEKIHQGVTNHG